LSIRASPEAFRECVIDFVAGIAQQCLGVSREVLVELKADGHPPPLGRDRYDALPRKSRCIGYGCANVLRLERRILVENPLGRLPGCEIVENDGNGNPRALKACSSMHDLGVDSNVRSPVHRRLRREPSSAI
jgi:hypothetical protein